MLAMPSYIWNSEGMGPGQQERGWETLQGGLLRGWKCKHEGAKGSHRLRHCEWGSHFQIALVAYMLPMAWHISLACLLEPG